MPRQETAQVTSALKNRETAVSTSPSAFAMTSTVPAAFAGWVSRKNTQKITINGPSAFLATVPTSPNANRAPTFLTIWTRRFYRITRAYAR